MLRFAKAVCLHDLTCHHAGEGVLPILQGGSSWTTSEVTQPHKHWREQGLSCREGPLEPNISMQVTHGVEAGQLTSGGPENICQVSTALTVLVALSLPCKASLWGHQARAAAIPQS